MGLLSGIVRAWLVLKEPVQISGISMYLIPDNGFRLLRDVGNIRQDVEGFKEIVRFMRGQLCPKNFYMIQSIHLVI